MMTQYDSSGPKIAPRRGRLTDGKQSRKGRSIATSIQLKASKSILQPSFPTRRPSTHRGQHGTRTWATTGTTALHRGAVRREDGT